MRLIDAVELLKKMLREGDAYTNDDIRHGYHNCQILVYDAPTIDAEPVIHGKWIENDNGTYSCSKCQSWIPNEQHYYARYCLRCGALMDEVEEGEAE